ncbi:carboxypeptidase regulatory-like domain-containing protein [Fibrella sp. HMF5335]|uniref:Carboxypeptidase regulatory-like domain-containing protein n=1 Tax=Fibrella rubiginis TaxID=2817060 RepID=A0A939K2Q5_9BACT|nr:carboxypeptidase-like regulatory domain-containing protein [Fibrella rubiginis]MBO0936564.1 carboxypeptidase regulatory-like domain-containing protein [Fibrella rubiginis]
MKALSILLFCCLSISYTFAQVTTSSYEGRITDKKGEGLPGATVQLTNLPTGTKYGTTTDLDGRYRIFNANPGGPYEVVITFVGYKTETRRDVTLQLGANAGNDVTLVDENTTLVEVVITANRGGDKQGAGINIGEQSIRQLPTLSRSFQDVTRLTPQASNNNSFAGTNFRYNNVTIDGTINNDAIGFSPSLGGQSGSSGQPGSSTRTNPVSLDAIQDVQVYLAPFDVKIGNFLGGSVNAVTRSGTNDVMGSVYAYGRSAGLVGQYSPADGANNAVPSSFHDLQTGFRVGLPIIKNKLFFFTNEEFTNRRDPVLFQAGTAGSLIKDAAVAQRISDFVQQNYGLDAGSFQSPYSIYSGSVKFFNRIDWNISDKHQLTLRNNTVFSEATNLERDAQNFRFGSIDFRQNNNQSSTVAELKSRFGGALGFSNSLILGYSTIHDYRTPLSNQPSFPQVEIAYNGGTILLGNDREATVFNMKQNTFEITDNLSFFKGKHAFTVGTHNELYSIDYGFVNSLNGRIAYSDFNTTTAGVTTTTSALDAFLSKQPNRVRGSYAFNGDQNNRDYQFNNPYARFNVNLLSVYFQDDIQLTNRLRISPGVRLDYSGLGSQPTLNPQVPATVLDRNYGTTYTTATPINQINNKFLNILQPSVRLGFNYDVKGDKSVVIRGGTGTFTGRIPFAWLGYAYYNDGVGFGAYDYNNIATTAAATRPKGDPLDPKTGGAAGFNAANAGTRTTQVDLIDNNFKMPQMWRNNLAVDYTVGGYKLTLEALYTQVIQDIKFQQVNTKDTVRYYSYDVDRQQPIYLARNGTAGAQRINSNFSNAYMLSNTNKGYRYSLTAQLQRQFPTGFGFSAAYTYGEAFDISNGIRNSMESNWQLNQSLTPNDPKLAYSNFDIRHRIVGNVNYRLNWNTTNATTITLFYSAQSGSPFTWGYVNANTAGTAQAAGLAYIPRDLTEAQKLIPDPTQAQNFLNYVNADPYLSTRKGNFTERNTGRTPWNNNMDLRFLHEIKLGGRKALQINYDIFNVLNLIDNKLGYYYFSPNTFNSTASVGLSRITNPATGDPTFRWSNPTAPYSIDQLASRWQMQFGARLLF